MAIYRIRYRGHSDSVLEWSMGLHASAVTGVAAALSAAAADAFSAFWDGVPAGTHAAKTLFANDTVADDVMVDELDGANVHNVAQSITTLALAGTAAGEPLSPNVAVVLSKVSDVPTRRGRGRSYTPPPTVDSLNSGRIAAASVTILIAAWTNLHASLVAADGGAYTPCILNGPGKFGDPPPQPFTPYNQVKVGNVFDTQRNRRNKLRETFSVGTF